MVAKVHNLLARRNIGAAKGLLHSLVPRAQCFCFYDRARVCIWSSEGAEDYELDNFVNQLPDNIICGSDHETGMLRRTLPSGRTILLLPVYGDCSREDCLGVLISVFSKNAGKSSCFNPTLLQSILLPAVEVIGESLRLNHELGRSKESLEAVENELKLVYRVDESIHGTLRSHTSLANLVGQSGRFLGIAYSALLIPSKRIRISATHASWKHVKRRAVDRFLLDTLFPKLENQRTPIVFEMPGIEGSENPAEMQYQALLCPLVDRSGNVEGMLAQLGRINGADFTARHIRFMSHIVRKIEYVIEQSFDKLTGLMNRTGLEAQLHESKKTLTQDGDTHQVIYFDVDNLSLVNDTFGRNAGDQVITRFARLIDEHLPNSAVASRLADDEFVVLFANADTDAAIKLTTAIRRDIDALRYLEGDKSLQVTVSAGISPMSAKHGEAEALLAARIACDAAKDHGRNCVEIYDQDDQSIIQRYDDLYLVSEIQNSLDSDSFTLLAQPIVPLDNDKAVARYEILLRMHDKQGERVASEALFSAAERYQLMPQIDRWVVSKVLSCLSEFAEILSAREIAFAINLSGQSLGDAEILSFVEDEIANCGIAPQNICFELTESAAVASLNRAKSFIRTLRKRGCRFSLDDFGSGLSSFAYLHSFEVDTLKIDGSFVRDICSNRISESMVAAITQVARVMELETVAEYVESADAIEVLRNLGVDYAQGYAVGMPEPLDQVLDRLAENPHSIMA